MQVMGWRERKRGVDDKRKYIGREEIEEFGLRSNKTNSSPGTDFSDKTSHAWLQTRDQLKFSLVHLVLFSVTCLLGYRVFLLHFKCLYYGLPEGGHPQTYAFGERAAAATATRGRTRTR